MRVLRSNVFQGIPTEDAPGDLPSFSHAREPSLVRMLAKLNVRLRGLYMPAKATTAGLALPGTTAW
jgi:hypothetical protein